MAPSPSQPERDNKTATEVIRDMTQYYKDLGLYDDDLWESAKDRMEKYVKEDIINLADDDIKDDLFKIRTLLRQNGVNIRRRHGLKLAKAFEDWLSEEDYGNWENDDLISVMKDHEKDLPECIKREFYGRGFTAKHLMRPARDTG